MQNGDEDSGPIDKRARRDVAQLRSEHEVLKQRFERDHTTLSGIPITLARIDERVNWLVDERKVQVANDREQSQEIATVKVATADRVAAARVGKWIVGLVLAAALGAVASYVASRLTAPQPTGVYQYPDPWQQRPGAMQPGRP